MYTVPQLAGEAHRTTPTATATSTPVQRRRLCLLCLRESRPLVQAVFALRFCCGGVLAAAHAGTQSVSLFTQGAAIAAAWILATMAGYLFNGLKDVREDRLNGVERPISRGELAPERAATVGWACVALAAILATSAGPLAMSALALFMALGYLYSAGPVPLKGRPLASLGTVLAGTALTYLAGALPWRGVAQDGWPWGVSGDTVVVVASLVLWTTLVGATTKDLSDLRGDLASGRRPLISRARPTAVRRGIATAAVLVAALPLLAGTPTPLTVALGCVLLTGAVAVGHRLTSAVGATDRAAARAPYRVFMGTQVAAHLLVVTSLWW